MQFFNMRYQKSKENENKVKSLNGRISKPVGYKIDGNKIKKSEKRNKEIDEEIRKKFEEIRKLKEEKLENIGIKRLI